MFFLYLFDTIKSKTEYMYLIEGCRFHTLSQKIFSIQVLKKRISPKKGFCKINNDRIKIVLLTEAMVNIYQKLF